MGGGVDAPPPPPLILLIFEVVAYKLLLLLLLIAVVNEVEVVVGNRAALLPKGPLKPGSKEVLMPRGIAPGVDSPDDDIPTAAAPATATVSTTAAPVFTMRSRVDRFMARAMEEGVSGPREDEVAAATAAAAWTARGCC